MKKIIIIISIIVLIILPIIGFTNHRYDNSAFEKITKKDFPYRSFRMKIGEELNIKNAINTAKEKIEKASSLRSVYDDLKMKGGKVDRWIISQLGEIVNNQKSIDYVYSSDCTLLTHTIVKMGNGNKDFRIEYENIIYSLLKEGADSNLSYPLRAAIDSRGKYLSVALLLCGADPNQVREQSDSEYHYLKHYFPKTALATAIDEDLLIPSKLVHRSVPLFSENLNDGKFEFIKLLIAAGVDANIEKRDVSEKLIKYSENRDNSYTSPTEILNMLLFV
ncbi:hypothetical protein, partial [Akkermansia sp. BIOML-A56]